jgi:periplasmic copper chaperone A
MALRARLLPTAIIAGGAFAIAASTSVSAHVSIAEQEAVTGAFTLLTFGVPHGCEKSPTTRVRIQMPETIPQVTPTVNARWDVEKVMTTLDEPIEAGHGEQITERDSEVVYTAKTPLPDGVRDAFVLSLQVPEDAGGTTLYFPTIQECEQAETAWIELPEAGQDGEELEAPAPSIAVVAAAADDGESAANGAADGAADAQDAAAETATADGDDDSGASTGLAIAGLVAGLAGLGVGTVALVRSRRA